VVLDWAMPLKFALFCSLFISFALAQTWTELEGDGCPDCADDERAIRVTAEVDNALAYTTVPPCTEDMREKTMTTLETLDVSQPAFVIPAKPTPKPQWLLDYLAASGADTQNFLGNLTHAYFSQCAVLGVILPEGAEYRGFGLAAAKTTAGDIGPCMAAVGKLNSCGVYNTEFSITPRRLVVRGRDVIVTVFRNGSIPTREDDTRRTAYFTVYYRP
jgi:hypothetical protein